MSRSAIKLIALPDTGKTPRNTRNQGGEQGIVRLLAELELSLEETIGALLERDIERLERSRAEQAKLQQGIAERVAKPDPEFAQAQPWRELCGRVGQQARVVRELVGRKQRELRIVEHLVAGSEPYEARGSRK